MVRYVAKSFPALLAAMALCSCTYLQARSVREIEGILLNLDEGRPIQGAMLVLSETRFPALPLPVSSEGLRAIAHTVTDRDGRFAFRVCMTEGRFILRLPLGQRDKVFWYTELTDVTPLKLHVQMDGRPDASEYRRAIEFWLGEEDSSLAESCDDF